MTKLLIDLATMLDLPDDVSGQVKLGLAEIANRLTEFDDRYSYRLVWLDDIDFETILPYLEVAKK